MGGGGGSSGGGGKNGVPSRDKLRNAANAPGKGNTTQVGRAFQKHIGRENTALKGQATGSALKNTVQGNNSINRLLNDPNAKYTYKYTKAFGKVLDVKLPDGSGARWSADGTRFICFLEP